MNIINYGGRVPSRKHQGDAGADCYALKDTAIYGNDTVCIDLGFGVEIPEGHVGFILPRSSMAAEGLVAQTVPIDSNYRGKVHAIITNYNNYIKHIKKGERIAQLVVLPCVMDDFELIEPDKASKTDRGDGAFGSTGK